MEDKKQKLKEEADFLITEFMFACRRTYNREKTRSYVNSKDWNCFLDIRFTCYGLLEENRVDEAEKFIGNLKQITEEYGAKVIRNKEFKKYIKKCTKSWVNKKEMAESNEKIM